MIRNEELAALRVRREIVAADYRNACLRRDMREASKLEKEQVALVNQILKKEIEQCKH